MKPASPFLRPLRAALYMAAVTAQTHNPVVRAEHHDDSAVHERTTQYVYRAHALDKVELVFTDDGALVFKRRPLV